MRPIPDERLPINGGLWCVSPLYTTQFIIVRTQSRGMNSPSIDTDPPRKSQLICPGCDYQSPPDGNWRFERRLSETVYECPRCRTEITRRPAERDRSVVAGLAAVPALAASRWRDSLREARQLFSE